MKKKFALSALAMLLAFANGVQAQGAKFSISSYLVEGNTLLPQAQVERILSNHTGSGRTLDDINAAADALRRAYEDAGYPVVKVFPPQQTASSGRVTLKVIEGVIQNVKIKGNEAYDNANIRASLPPLQDKAKPNAKQIVAAIAAANENPAKQVAVNFQSAEELGMIDAVVNVTEDRPEKFLLNYDNMGSKSTGVNRVSLGYQNANLFNLDHMVTLQVGTSTDYPNRSLSLSGGYRIPFYAYGLSLDMIAAYSDSNASTNVGVGLDNKFNGQGVTLGLRLNQALASIGEFRHKMIYGFDYKDFDNNCSTGGVTSKCGTITSQPASVTYFAQLAKPEYQLSGSLSLAVNVPGGAHGGSDFYQLARAGADDDWNAWRMNANLIVPLPSDFQFKAGLAGQISRDRLIAGEQFGIGGASSVRGYIERTAAGDQGYSGNIEMYSPEVGKHVAERVSLRGLVFYDFGKIRFNTPTVGEKETTLTSVGTGFRFGYGRDLTVKLDVGFTQNPFAGSDAAGNTRTKGQSFGHAAVNLSF